ncbi:MAG: AAA family ATPase [Patescibacteria group bacterium]|nr:AAA family ATPase [Patescibacteria group bacterium]
MTQQEALDILKMGQNVFLTGPPGSGKTFLLNKYINYLKNQGKDVGITASTGIAATHMNGVTIHSWSGLGIKEKLTSKDMQSLLKKFYLKKKFATTKVLIIDEVSMLHAFQFDLLNQICQAFRGSLKPFGGLQIICSGDFFQLPPVEKNGQPKFITQADIWQKMDIKICYLHEQYRQIQNDKLLTLLNYIRQNEVEKSREILTNLSDSFNSSLTTLTKLYTHNLDVDAINNRELAKINGPEFVYYMQTRGNKKVASAMIKSCLAPEKLVLKKGAQVMFVKNNFEQGYVNGTRGVVIGFNESDAPIIKTFNGQEIIVKPMSWVIEEDNFIKAEIQQIPLRLAWAITVHKSQGMNLDAAEIDLSKCFVEGMGYVALSRLSSLQGLKLNGLNELALSVNKDVLELDKKFEKLSRDLAEDLQKMNSREKEKQQRDFLTSLPQVGSRKKNKNAKALKSALKGAKKSTYKKTEELVLEKMLLREMARHRGLTEDTILSHLEKLIQDNFDLDIEYLKPANKDLEKIKMAFYQLDTRQLTPVKEFLNDQFSYKELRLARLFLDKDS